MRKERLTVPPVERLAKRICMAANARGATTIGDVIAAFNQKYRRSVVEAAVGLAVERQWLKADGANYALTPVGIELGSQSRRGPRVRRAIPF